MRSHVVSVPDIIRHDAGISAVACATVVVSSVTLPSAPKVIVPLTSSVPSVGALEQFKPNPVRSTMPVTGRHDPATAHVPTTSPPHAVTFSQDASMGPVVLVPPSVVEPPAPVVTLPASVANPVVPVVPTV